MSLARLSLRLFVIFCCMATIAATRAEGGLVLCSTDLSIFLPLWYCMVLFCPPWTCMVPKVFPVMFGPVVFFMGLYCAKLSCNVMFLFGLVSY